MQTLLPYLITINALGLYLMHQDKRNAVLRCARVPEAVLILIALLGGSAGAAVGMLLFRHKTRKPLFSIGLPVILLVQTAILFWV